MKFTQNVDFLSFAFYHNDVVPKLSLNGRICVDRSIHSAWI